MESLNTHFSKLNSIIDKNIYIIPQTHSPSDTVIVCHCSKQYQNKDDGKLHKTLYYFNTVTYENEEIEEDIKYIDIDIRCVNDKWNYIESNSKMYIWSINCPIYESYNNDREESKVIDDILKNSLRVLKQNGKVIFPVNNSYVMMTNRLIKYFQDKTFNGFTYSIEPIAKFPYIIDISLNIDTKNYYVFTKN